MSDEIVIGLKCPKPEGAAKVLHLCCGTRSLPDLFQDDWIETRLDIDKGVSPDVVGDVRDLPWDDDSFHIVWLEAGLEHLCEYDVNRCLMEAFRVLVPGGMFYCSVPNLEAIAIQILQGNLESPLLETGDHVRCTWLDAIYGHQDSIRHNAHMSHRFGFTPSTLSKRLSLIGFFDIKMSTYVEMLDVYSWKGMSQ